MFYASTDGLGPNAKDAAMEDATLEARLESLGEQDYPLAITEDDALALVECVRRIMRSVPEDDRLFVRADYDLATHALLHPDFSLRLGADLSEYSGDHDS